MKHIWIVSLIGLFLMGCSSQQSSETVDRSTQSETQTPQPTVRYLAWLQGDVQTEYEAEREVAGKRLSKYDKDPPPIQDSDEYLEYASLLDAAGRRTQAEKKLKAYLEKYPSDSKALFLLGSLYLRQNKKELARYLYDKAQKDKRFEWKSLLYNNLGMLALKERNRRLALEYFQKAVKESPRLAAPLVNLGALYLQSLSYGEAEKVFRKAYNTDESFQDAVVGLGSALEGQGKFAEAHKAYEDFLKENPGALTVLYNDAILLGKRLNRRAEATQKLLRYVQRGGKAAAKAQELIRNWR